MILTGHTRDPRAQNCHYDGEGPNPNPELVMICGRQLVVTDIEPRLDIEHPFGMMLAAAPGSRE